MLKVNLSIYIAHQCTQTLHEQHKNTDDYKIINKKLYKTVLFFKENCKLK